MNITQTLLQVWQHKGRFRGINIALFNSLGSLRSPLYDNSSVHNGLMII